MNKVILYDTSGLIFVTRNFGDDIPIWKRYKRLGWAMRYLNKENINA